jgi:hypothetical protein
MSITCDKLPRDVATPFETENTNICIKTLLTEVLGGLFQKKLSAPFSWSWYPVDQIQRKNFTRPWLPIPLRRLRWQADNWSMENSLRQSLSRSQVLPTACMESQTRDPWMVSSRIMPEFLVVWSINHCCLQDFHIMNWSARLIRSPRGNVSRGELYASDLGNSSPLGIEANFHAGEETSVLNPSTA